MLNNTTIAYVACLVKVRPIMSLRKTRVAYKLNANLSQVTKRKSHSRNKKEDKVRHNSFTVCPNKSYDNRRSPLVNGLTPKMDDLAETQKLKLPCLN